jgi:hypothetical protein
MNRELEELKATVADLGQRLSALEGAQRRTVVAARAPEPQVQILTGEAATGRSSFPMPSNTELLHLRKLVLAKYPMLKPAISARFADDDERNDVEAFVSAFKRIAELGRLDLLDSKRALSWWVDEAGAWLQERGFSAQVPLKPYMAATIAHGDVLYSLDHWPHEAAVGLAAHGGRIADGAGWRRALAGRLLGPIEQPKRQESQTEVRYG